MKKLSPAEIEKLTDTVWDGILELLWELKLSPTVGGLTFDKVSNFVERQNMSPGVEVVNSVVDATWLGLIEVMWGLSLSRKVGQLCWSDAKNFVCRHKEEIASNPEAVAEIDSR